VRDGDVTSHDVPPQVGSGDVAPSTGQASPPTDEAVAAPSSLGPPPTRAESQPTSAPGPRPSGLGSGAPPDPARIDGLPEGWYGDASTPGADGELPTRSNKDRATARRTKVMAVVGVLVVLAIVGVVAGSGGNKPVHFANDASSRSDQSHIHSVSTTTTTFASTTTTTGPANSASTTAAPLPAPPLTAPPPPNALAQFSGAAESYVNAVEADGGGVPADLPEACQQLDSAIQAVQNLSAVPDGDAGLQIQKGLQLANSSYQLGCNGSTDANILTEVVSTLTQAVDEFGTAGAGIGQGRLSTSTG